MLVPGREPWDYLLSSIPLLSIVPRLTAFVLRCFLQAQTYVQINQRVLSRAVTWLLRQQGPRGEFSEAGRVIHTEMQGGLDSSSAGLTAFVLMALLEDDSYVVRLGRKRESELAALCIGSQ